MDSFPTDPETPGVDDALDVPDAAPQRNGSGEGAQSALQRLKELERSRPAAPLNSRDPQHGGGR